MQRLHDALSDTALLVSADPARAIVERIVGTDAAVDDIAVLVVTISSP